MAGLAADRTPACLSEPEPGGPRCSARPPRRWTLPRCGGPGAMSAGVAHATPRRRSATWASASSASWSSTCSTRRSSSHMHRPSAHLRRLFPRTLRPRTAGGFVPSMRAGPRRPRRSVDPLRSERPLSVDRQDVSRRRARADLRGQPRAARTGGPRRGDLRKGAVREPRSLARRNGGRVGRPRGWCAGVPSWTRTHGVERGPTSGRPDRVLPCVPE